MKPIFYFIVLLLFTTSCQVGRFFIYNFADIKDYKKFPTKEIQNDSSHTFTFQELPDSQKAKVNIDLTINDKKYKFEEALKKEGTVAFLIIRRDTLLYEQYFNKYEESSIVTSFSMAKSFVSALVGIAVDEGHIDSVKDTLTKYIPDLPKEPFGQITIEDLLDMRSGLKFSESYINPFGHVANSYYGLNLKRMTRKLKAKAAPGKSFDYISVNTQLLAWLVEEATGKKVSEYLEEKIWQPLGMEYPASWSIDSKKNQTEKAFCCLNARARDFAKFGRLYLHKGYWQGEQIISQDWIGQSLDFKPVRFYSYQWWGRPDSYYAQGILGQFVYVDPAKEIIMVRLGKKYGKIPWPSLFEKLVNQL